MLDVTQLVRGGWGGDDNIPCTCTHVGCYATGQGWVGGGDDNIPCTCTHVGCYATGRGWSHSLFCTHVGCYATGQGWVGGGMITFLALAHMLDATQQVGDDHIPCFAHMLDATQLVRGGWGGDDNVPCTCTHVGCYATGQGWVGGGMITFLALAHMLDATQLVGDDHIPCFAHMLDATQLVRGGWGGGMITFLALNVWIVCGRAWSDFCHLN